MTWKNKKWSDVKDDPVLLEEKRRYQREWLRKKRDANPALHRIRRQHSDYKYLDKKNDRPDPYNFSVNDLLVMFSTNKCIYCGAINDLTLDRLDESRGHCKDNVVVACYSCNVTRSRYGIDVKEMKKVGKTLRKVLSQQYEKEAVSRQNRPTVD